MLLSGLSILVADDEPAIREILMEELTYRGAKVSEVKDGKQAWSALCKSRFDVLLSDVRMPDGNGIELIQKISVELPYKPLIFLCTGYADLSLEEAQKHGVIEIFSKPFDINHISKAIAEHVAKSGSSRTHA